MTTIPVTVTLVDHNGQSVTSAGGSVTPGGSALVDVGETAILGTAGSGIGGVLLAQPVTLTQTGILKSLSFYVATGGGQLRLALYSDSAGKPGSKIAETNAFTVGSGWNTQSVLSTPLVAAGKVWLAFLPQLNTLVARGSTAGGPTIAKAFAFGTMPATYPSTGTTTIPGHVSFYGTFQESNVPTVWVNSVIPAGPIPPSTGGSSGSTSADIWATLDGRANAPVGGVTPFSTWLSAYAPVGSRVQSGLTSSATVNAGNFQPPWRVPGVDYGVGPPSATVFKVPGVDSLTSVAIVDTTNHFLDLQQSNLIFDGWDFSDWGIDSAFSGSSNTVPSNTTFLNCKWAVGAHNRVPIEFRGIDQDDNIQNLTITNCLFEGNGSSRDIGGKGLVMFGGSGTVNISYCLFQNAPTDFMQLGANFIGSSSPCIINLKYNAFYNAARNPGGHTDWLQTAEITTGTSGKLYGNISIEFNLVIQANFADAAGGAQGWTLNANNKVPYTQFHGGDHQWNTDIITATESPIGSMGYVTIVALNTVQSGDWTISNNYIDPTRLDSPQNQFAWKTNVGTGPFSGATQISAGNINMTNGAAINNPSTV